MSNRRGARRERVERTRYARRDLWVSGGRPRQRVCAVLFRLAQEVRGAYGVIYSTRVGMEERDAVELRPKQRRARSQGGDFGAEEEVLALYGAHCHSHCDAALGLVFKTRSTDALTLNATISALRKKGDDAAALALFEGGAGAKDAVSALV